MKKINILLYILLFSINTWGQLQLPNVIPPSPEAAQLAKFVETPVSLYNGTPTVSIPITTVSAGNVSVPVSLIYDAKGVMVAEQASRVGTGWTLNAGGAITRQVRMNIDESNNGYMQHEFTDDFHSNPSTRGPLWTQSSYPDTNDNVDFYPDLYFFNFLGFSGTFIFDQLTKLPVLQKADDIKVIPTYQNSNSYYIVSWELIDSNGVRYFFGDSEIDKRMFQENYKWTHGVGGGDQSLGNDTAGQHTNSWHLYKIITPEGNEVDFEYEKEFVFYYSLGGDQKNDNTYSTSYSRLQMQQSQLKSIAYKNKKIYFDKANTTREDLSQGYALKTVRIVEKNGTFETTIKKFDLIHSYTTAPDNNNQLGKLKLVDDFAKKRLFLNEINEISRNEQDTLRYLFDYNPVVLPNRHSTSVDNWGYYNGKNNGEYLKSVFDSFDSRIVNSTLSEAGLLKKIIYPTGGQTEFIYEHNRLKPPHFFSGLIFPKTNPIVQGTIDVIQNPIDYNGNKYIIPITVEGEVASIPMTVKVTFDWTDCPEGVDSADCQYQIYLKQTNNVVITKLLRGQSTLTLSPGDYIIEAIPKQPHDEDDWEASNFTINFQWTISVPNENDELYGPGKRIQKIIQRDGETITSEKEYFYIDDNNEPSGRLFSIPAYHDIAKQIGNGYLIGGSLANRATPVGLFIGNKYGYSKVTELLKGNDKNIKTEYYFTNFGDVGEFYKFPYHLPSDMGWTRGMPIETKYYQNNQGTTYSLIKKVKNKYVYYNNSNAPIADSGIIENIDPEDDGSQMYYSSFRKYRIPIFKFGKSIEDLLIDSTLDSSDYLVSYYYAGRCNLEKTEEFDYFDNNEVIKTTTFNHDAINHHQIKSKIFTDSQNNILETQYSYALDPEMSGKPHVNDLIDRSMVGLPLQTKVYKNGQKLSVQETEYEDWGNDLLAPILLKDAKGENGSLEARIRFLKYDSSGNPLEVQKENGTIISYIWGYDHTQPVAKIENMAYDNIPPGRISLIHSATNESEMFSALQELRNDTALGNSLVTTLTYVPLVGVKTMTDPRGYVTTYHYDAFNRLEKVTDRQGNILSENEYHYRTQN